MSTNKTKMINIRVTEKTKKKLEAAAKADKRSLTNLIQKILEEAIEKPAE